MGDRELVKSRKMTCKSQVLPWWLERGEVKTTEKNALAPVGLPTFFILHEPKFARLSLRCICGRTEAICAVFDLVWKGPDGADRVILLLFPPNWERLGRPLLFLATTSGTGIQNIISFFVVSVSLTCLGAVLSIWATNSWNSNSCFYKVRIIVL
jgi:hypothetical protein